MVIAFSANRQLAMDKDVIVVLFEAESGKVKEMLGIFTVVVLQSVVSRAAEERETAKFVYLYFLFPVL